MKKEEKITLTLWERKFSRCLLDCQKGYLTGEYFGEIDPFDFEEINSDMFITAHHRKLSKMLIDTSGAQDEASPLGSFSNWLPAASYTPLKYLALVVPKGKELTDQESRLSNVNKEEINIRVFNSPQEGIAWLERVAN